MISMEAPAEDALQGKLEEVRESRRLAQTKGAFTAVAQLHKLEIELLDAIETKRAASGAGDASGPLDLAGRIQAIGEMIPTLPQPLVEALYFAAARRLGRPV